MGDGLLGWAFLWGLWCGAALCVMVVGLVVLADWVLWRRRG